MLDKTIGFIGCGNMATAMISGLIKRGVSCDNIIGSDPYIEKINFLKKEYNIITKGDNKEVAILSDILFISVKPDKYKIVLDGIKGDLKEGVIVVSIAPSISLEFMRESLGENIKLLRAMPNTPALIGMGITALCPNQLVSVEDKIIIESIFSSFGEYEYIDEELFPAVIGISGSSPAYTYMFIEALADAGVYSGLPRDKAYKFAATAVMGSAGMVLKTGEHPGSLKDKVCSPKGTTIEAVKELEKNNFRYAVMKAAIAACEKSRKMS